MRIDTFRGKGIWGYLDVDITFDRYTSFLIGLNGAGKSTVLELIEGMLLPSYAILTKVRFDEIELTGTLGRKKFRIQAKQRDGVLDFATSYGTAGPVTSGDRFRMFPKTAAVSYPQERSKFTKSFEALPFMNKVSSLGRDSLNELMHLLDTTYPERKDSFFKCINKFREDHDRRLSWLPDTCSSGEPVVLPDDLSSGERRLFEILGTVILLPESKPGIVLIDDPELHLHLAWQEILVDTLREIRPKAQFVFATHAPAIVARNNNMDRCINITKARRSE